MSAPGPGDIVEYPGADGTPTDLVSPYGGAINTTSILDSTVIGEDLYTIFLNPTNTSYYGILYFKNNCASPGSLQTARVYNRSGAVVNTSAGVCQYVSTLAADTGQVVTTGKVGGVFTQETVTLTGTTPVMGATTWDSGSVIRHEYLNTGGTPGIPVGNITVSCASQIVAVIYGTYANPTSQDLSCTWASTEFTFALATAKNTTISGANRLTAPTSGISAFSNATYWAGNDQSLPVPSGFLDSGDSIGLVFCFTAYAGAPLPVSNQIDHFPILLGVPSASL